MSGYRAGTNTTGVTAEELVPCPQEPFRIGALAARVREVLEA